MNKPQNLNKLKKNRSTGLVIFGLIAVAFSFPIYYVLKMQDKKPLEGNLPKGSGIRGSFLNSGSRDMGRDDKVYKNSMKEKGVTPSQQKQQHQQNQPPLQQ
ncbi:hypothetical protein DLAC_10992 [Tieghemostelium lacteum]|uniref:Uncharacterized protein n=1 Tax=Tieghemostelium lacteum TaxID=361077 RepID=A0A151Z301_TIELA|nr:hypothetical protein DLAC_10992 [Tieghemostelium lacteum]|eukprot:KYQ88297.1 hypothetical protein DLAC_10992 [Tieghemostelium lacteum]